VGASAVESTAVRSGRSAVRESSSDRPIPRPWQDGITCSSAISKELSSQVSGATPSPNPAVERAASAAATMSCHHCPLCPWKP